MYECTLYMYKYERKLLNMKLLCVEHTHVCRFCFHMNSYVRLVGHRQQRNYTSNAPIGAYVTFCNENLNVYATFLGLKSQDSGVDSFRQTAKEKCRER